MTSSSSGVSKEFNQSTLGGRRRHRHWNRQRDRRTRVRQNCLVHKHNRWRRASTHVRYLSRCRSRRLAKSSRSGRLGGGSDHLRSTGHDAHLHLHSEVIRRKSKKGAVKRDRVARIGHGRNGDQADVADAAAPTRESTRAPGRSSVPAGRGGGLRDTPRRTVRRNQMSAPPRSSALRSRGNCHGRGTASPTAAGFLSLPAACSGSRDGCPAAVVREARGR